MSDRNVYAWRPQGGFWGFPIGGFAQGHELNELVFRLGRPLPEAVAHWKRSRGIDSVIPSTKPTDEELKMWRTLKWAENPTPIQCSTLRSRRKLDVLDTPSLLSSGTMVVSEKVLQILTEVCPNDFEAYPLIVQTSTGPSGRSYFLINITHLIFPDIEEERSIFMPFPEDWDKGENSISAFDRLILKENCMGNICLGRMYHRRIEPLIGKPVIDAFQKANITGFEYLPLEDKKDPYYNFKYLSGTNI